ncbi:MAG: ATP-binding protein [Lachnospiraceae bacterium]
MKKLLVLMIPASQILLVVGYICSQQKLDLWGLSGILVFLIADGVLFYELICGRKKEEIQKEIEEVSYLQEIECIRHEMFAEKEQELLHLKQIFDDQLENIRKRIANGEVEAAKVEMDHFQKSLDETRPEEYCQNRVVNAVMSEKAKQCRKKNIELDAELMVPAALRMDALQICSLFSNLMDNAIEAVTIENTKECRWIRVNTEVKNAYLCIKISNPAAPSHVVRKKRDGHGYGTKIIQDIVKQYDGVYKTEYRQRVYTATLGIKIN